MSRSCASTACYRQAATSAQCTQTRSCRHGDGKAAVAAERTAGRHNAGHDAVLNGDSREPVRLHDLRHTYVALRLAAGATLAEGAALARRLMEVFGAGPTRFVGWQLQGHQFRLFAAVFNDLAGPSLKLQEARSKVAKKLADTGASFDFTKVQRVLGSRAFVPPRARPDRNGFNKYDPAFVYRYLSVPDMTQGELIKLGRFYLKAALATSIRPPRSTHVP